MSAKSTTPPQANSANSVDGTSPKCGLIVPISSIDGCSEAHWLEVREIIQDAAERAGFQPQLVSAADDVGVIQKRIIQNVYDNEIVVCDVSGKNPNVMFELGLRLAFDKPTVIVKDDKTSYSFDTAPIEHIGYPRDLRFALITKFKDDLSAKIKATYDASKKSGYTTFLKHFGQFTVAKLETATVSRDDFILQELTELRRQISRMEESRVRPRGIGEPSDRAVMRSVVDAVMKASMDNYPAMPLASLRGLLLEDVLGSLRKSGHLLSESSTRYVQDYLDERLHSFIQNKSPGAVLKSSG